MTSALRRMRAHPRLTGLAVVVVLLAAGLTTYLASRNSGASASAASTTVQTVATGVIRQSVSSTGTLAPAEQENLTFPVSGEVTSVAVSVGQQVKKGQILARIDSASLAVDVAQAKATVASSQAKVAADTSNGVSDTQLAADTATLSAANNQLASATRELGQATMTSPIAGVVAGVNITAGQSVSGSSSNSASGGSSSGSGTGGGGTGGGGTGGSGTSASSSSTSAQILVISTDAWIVNATVDATSVGLIKKGEQAQLTVTGGSASPVYGTIASIGLVSASSAGTASYPVVIDVTGAPAGLHDGASVTAALIYKQVSDAVVVPSTALHRDSSGAQYVEKVLDGKTVHAAVQVGISSGLQTQVTSGLAVGDKIVVPQIVRRAGTGTRTGGGGGGQVPGGGQFPGGGGFRGGRVPGGGATGG